jgi:hypothetical protein
MLRGLLTFPVLLPHVLKDKTCEQKAVVVYQYNDCVQCQEKMNENKAIYPDGRMNPQAAALYVGLPVKTLAKKRCNGTAPRFVKRGRIFYYRDDLDEWLRAGRASSTGELKGPKLIDCNS